jgi:methylthioribose-1-phosphate isomerase
MNVLVNGRREAYRTVSFDSAGNRVLLIDQKLLPHDFEVAGFGTYRETAMAIRDMTVRGAGAIGATAAYGFAQGIRAWAGGSGISDGFMEYVDEVFRTLGEARPTAVDPMNALRWMRKVMTDSRPGSTEEWGARALDLANQFADEDAAHCQAIGGHGASLIRDGMNILTHCNAGWLAFVDYGSATAPMYSAWDSGTKFHVWCDETRPRLQGAALTAWELHNHGVPHTVIADNAAGFLMSQGKVDMVITGSDRVIARTGEVANKIGTFTKAVLAHYHKIPFYVAIPLSTLDWDLSSGADIPIEERGGEEVYSVNGISLRSGARESVRVANRESPVSNYGFDITPPELITGIITPKGIFNPSELGGLEGLAD